MDAAAESSDSDGGGGGGGEVDVKRMKLDVDAAADVSGGAVAEAAAGYAGQSHVTLLCLNAPVAKQEPDAELDDSASYSHCTPLLLRNTDNVFIPHYSSLQLNLLDVFEDHNGVTHCTHTYTQITFFHFMVKYLIFAFVVVVFKFGLCAILSCLI